MHPTILDSARMPMAEAARKKIRKHNESGGLSAEYRQHLPRGDFALPGKGEGKKGAGAGSYPIPDESHARNALSRVAQHGSSAEKAEVRRKVHEKYPDIGKKKKSKLYSHPSSAKM